MAILRRHLLEKEPISKLCDELALQPTVFYRWQKELFENGAAAFQSKTRSNSHPEQEHIAYLEKKIQSSTRYARPDCGLRAELVGEDGDQRRAFIGWLDVTASKFYDWRERYGRVNEHNGWVPRDFWGEAGHCQLSFEEPLEGYRRLTFMMLDADVVAVSPANNEIILQGAKEKYPEAKPRIISDNGPSSSPKTSRSSFAFRE